MRVETRAFARFVGELVELVCHKFFRRRLVGRLKHLGQSARNQLNHHPALEPDHHQKRVERCHRLPLLHDMRQFVGEKLPPDVRARRKLSGTEDNIAADGISQRINRARRLGGLGVGVHTHLAEVVAETQPRKIRASSHRAAGPA